MKYSTIGFAAALLLTGTPAIAEIIDHDWYTEDTETGLFWADWTDTRGLSVDEVLNQMGPGQRFEGWRHANNPELESLYWNFGLQSPQINCYQTSATYCGLVPSEDAEEVEIAIRMLGDTYNVWAKSFDHFDIATNEGTYIASAYITHVLNGNPQGAYIADEELIDRETGETVNRDSSDSASSGYWIGQSQRSLYSGHALLRNIRPTVRPIIPPPEGAIDFDTVQPEDLGLQLICADRESPANRVPCIAPFGWNSDSSNISRIWLGISDHYDVATMPVIRVTGFDYQWISNSYKATCTTADNPYNRPSVMWIADSDLPTDISTAPQGGGWCRANFNPTASSVLHSPDHPDIPGVRIVAELGVAETRNQVGFHNTQGLSIDNIVLDTPTANMEIDFAPSSELNHIRPYEPGLYSVAIKTTRVADGDLYDFDGWQARPAFLRFGPDGAESVSVVSEDYDSDGDYDWIYTFRVEDSGITCNDTTLVVSSYDQFSPDPVWGSDAIHPIDCDGVVAIDVEPWADDNEVRPNDDYGISVAVMSKSVAGGDDSDLDATEIDPSTLAFGAGLAPNIAASPLVGDYNDDSIDDIVVAFNSFDSAIACGDTEVTLKGTTYSGLPIEGTGSITTADCETSGCHP